MLVILQQRPSFGSGESGNFSGNQFPTGAYGGMADVNSPVGATFRDPSMNQLNRSAPDPRNWFLEVVAENRSVSKLMDSATQPVVPFQRTQLPSGASNTVFVEGLPPDCTEREVARIPLTLRIIILFPTHCFSFSFFFFFFFTEKSWAPSHEK